jgi:ParB/RepB/Spo0J family partition protein
MNKLILVKIADLIASPTNPRKTFKEKSLMEMATSIKKHGIIQPPSVRAHQTQIGKYEIVCGERRTRASKMAGFSVIQVLLKVLSNTEVLDFQILENLCREDVPPLEEAEVLLFYYENKNFTIEEISLKVGCSISYIYSRIKLNELIVELKELLSNGELNVSIAVFIASLPPDVQRSLIQIFNVDSDDNYIIPTLNKVRSIVRKGFMLYLSDSIFDIRETNYSVGSCITCQFNTSCNHTLFPELDKSARCVNRPCFYDKTSKHANSVQQAYMDEQAQDELQTYYVSTEMKKDTEVEIGKFEKIYYANEYLFVPYKSSNTFSALVVNDGTDYMNKRFIKLKVKSFIQSEIPSYQNQKPSRLGIESEYIEMMKSKNGELETIIKNSLFDKINNILKSYDEEKALKLIIFSLGKSNPIRSVNLLSKFNFMKSFSSELQNTISQKAKIEIWYNRVMELSPITIENSLQKISLILAIDLELDDNSIQLNLLNKV